MLAQAQARPRDSPLPAPRSALPAPSPPSTRRVTCANNTRGAGRMMSDGVRSRRWAQVEVPARQWATRARSDARRNGRQAPPPPPPSPRLPQVAGGLPARRQSWSQRVAVSHRWRADAGAEAACQGSFENGRHAGPARDHAPSAVLEPSAPCTRHQQGQRPGARVRTESAGGSGDPRPALPRCARLCGRRDAHEGPM